ncbi:hypothetical protein PENSPDRAFT_107982 [Peniophora sp. CONT]|nr:hypothetical protein PENSPDRAFT_107982 [Peniophora sp. CONT]
MLYIQSRLPAFMLHRILSSTFSSTGLAGPWAHAYLEAVLCELRSLEVEWEMERIALERVHRVAGEGLFEATCATASAFALLLYPPTYQAIITLCNHIFTHTVQFKMQSILSHTSTVQGPGSIVETTVIKCAYRREGTESEALGTSPRIELGLSYRQSGSVVYTAHIAWTDPALADSRWGASLLDHPCKLQQR